MKYKMIVLDLDGTLTNSKKEITPHTLNALITAQQKGIVVVLASGRPTYGIVPLAKQLKLEQFGGYILAYNGGKIVDCKTAECMLNQELNPELVPTLHDEAIAAGLQILTYQGNGIAATKRDDEYVQHEAFINKMPVVEYSDFKHQVEFPINKCLIVGNPTALHALELKLAKDMEGQISVYRSADFFLECVPLGIEKSQSIDKLISTIGIKREEVVAMGDGYNDLGMIEYAGLGIAMANANDDVKRAANFVTLSNEEDGVAYAIEKFVL